MRLTPADVHNVAFKKPSIGKRGYDEDEVDAFLDLVEAELARLIEENNELTQRVAAGSNGEAPRAAAAGQPADGQAGQAVEAQPVEAQPQTPVSVEKAPAAEAVAQPTVQAADAGPAGVPLAAGSPLSLMPTLSPASSRRPTARPSVSCSAAFAGRSAPGPPVGRTRPRRGGHAAG